MRRVCVGESCSNFTEDIGMYSGRNLFDLVLSYEEISVKKPELEAFYCALQGLKASATDSLFFQKLFLCGLDYLSLFSY